MSVKVIDNYLKEEDFRAITSIVLSNKFSWAFGVVLHQHVNDVLVEEKDNFQFEHLLFNTSPPIINIGKPFTFFHSEALECIKPLLDNLPVRALIRAKFNLNPRTSINLEHGYHTDFLYPESTTSVFYLNTNNGYTKFEDGTKVESVANRLVTFPSNTPHTGSTCTDEKRRVVLNLNYF